jgi:DNA-binding response OmpR family regulator
VPLDVLIIAKPYEAELMRGALAACGHRPIVWDGRDDPCLMVEREPPAVIVLSLRLQQADGAVVLGQIREGAEGGQVPVVLIGDVASPVATLADAVGLGANQLLLRPLESTLLTAKVEAVAGQGGPPEPPEQAIEAPAALGDELSTSAADQAVDAVPERSGFHDDLELELRYELDAVERRLFPQEDQRGSVLGDQLVREGAASGELDSAKTDSAVEESPGSDEVLAGEEAVRQGSIGSPDVALLLHGLWRERFTGRAVLGREQVSKTLWLDHGEPVFAASSQPQDRLLEVLRREGKIDDDRYKVLGESASGEVDGQKLVGAGVIDPDELPALQRHWLGEIFFSLFGWEDGQYELHAESLPPEQTIALKDRPVQLLVEGIYRRCGIDFLVQRVGPPETVVRSHFDRLGEAELEAIGPEGQRVIEALGSGRPLAEAISSSGSDRLKVYQVAYALSVIGAGGAEGSDEQAEQLLRVDRQRIRNKHAQVCEADYFALLGLGADASAHEVRRAYERLRREFDQEVVPPDLAGEFSRELAEIVQVLDEAYQVLGDDELRQAYRETL